jgi:dipeptidyl aminopeptidase/acylaminoacyl peptidase
MYLQECILSQRRNATANVPLPQRAAQRVNVIAAILYFRLLLLALMLNYPSVSVAQASPSLITTADLERFASIGDPGDLSWLGGYHGGEPGEGDPGIFSPDRLHIAVVVRGGDPKKETNTASLFLYDSTKLMDGFSPMKLVEFASATKYQPIALVQWLPDNHTLIFSGTDGISPSHVYRVDIRTKVVDQLTNNSNQLVWYGISASGNRVVTFGSPPSQRPDLAECQRHGCRVTASSLWDAQSWSATAGVDQGSIYDLVTRGDRQLVTPESRDKQLNFCDPELAGGISPDGRYAVRLCRLQAQFLPQWWSDYRMNPWLRDCGEHSNVRCWRRAMVVDLESGEPSALTDAPQVPAFWTAPPIWIDGGRNFIIPAAFETLTGVDDKERARRKSTYAVQLVDPATRAITRIGSLDPRVATVKHASWDDASQTLVVEGQDGAHKSLASQAFQRRQGQWLALAHVPAVSASESGPRLSIDQSLNNRPVLIAVDPKTGVRKTILDPNPWLDQRELGKVEAISWPTASGKTWHGGLYYPPDYRPGTRYPLLLQTHGFMPNLFSLHGYARNFPGQALAAHGIFVLQIDENDGDVYETPKVWAYDRVGYEGAIDYLDKLGLINRQRVGTVGWSATGPTTASMFTHSNYPIAAAAFTDTGVWGWWYNFISIPSDGPADMFGTSPFGPGLANWLELSPTFNLKRVQTPLLIWSAENLLSTWDWYSGLRGLHKPVELWSMEGNGTHDIYQASMRIRMNQLLVDWFCFWLNGEERAVPGAYTGETAASLSEQYVRWHELRALHEADIKNPRPPLLHWTATPLTDSPPSSNR